VHLYTQYRDSEPAEFSLLWSFSNRLVKAPRDSDQRDRRVPERIGLKTKEVLPEDELMNRCIDKLERGTEYRSDDLRKVWKIPAAKAMDLYARLLETGILERTGEDGIVRLAESTEAEENTPEETREGTLEQTNKPVDTTETQA